MAVTSHGIGAHLAEHGLLAAVRLGAERGAFQHLAEVVRLRLGKAVVDRGRSEHATVAAAAADDHVRALLQQIDERMDAGHRDDPFGRVEFGLGERAMPFEPCTISPARIRRRRTSLSDFGIEIAERNRFNPCFAARSLMICT